MNSTDRPDTTRVAFCQNCGRPLTAEEARNVGSAVFCEPCLVSRVAASETRGGAAGAGSYGFSGTSSGVNYNFQGSTPPPAPPPVPGVPNPGLAALLGFIPGVGAFYNGQYAKGVVHLIVFAILTSLSGQNGIFGLFVAGWIFYQVIEAHHTARARRDGTPLPNPFGLNDIGERLGFGRAWPSSPVAGASPAAPPVATAETQGSTGYAPPASAYPPPQAGYASYAPPPASAPSSWGVPGSGVPGSGVPGASAGVYGAVPPPMPEHIPDVTQSGLGSRFPVGAIVLIGLGVLFLIGNSGLFRGFPIHQFIPFLLIGIGVWIFVRKMTEMGGGFADDGSATYRLRLFRAARGSVWIILVGVLFLLDNFHILSWGRSWPLFIIVAGVMTFAQRSVYSAATMPPYGYPAPVAPAAAAPEPAPAVTSTAIVPTHSDDREGN